MKNICQVKNCIKCCKKTSMPLSKKDIDVIKNLGFSLDYFVIEKNGWLQLKNKDGKCVFHDGKLCLIYENRPEGCKLYPIIYDKDKNSPIFDKDCPYPEKFMMSNIVIKDLIKQVKKLEFERNKIMKI